MPGKLIVPPSNLKSKSNEPGGMSPEDALKRGEQFVKQLKFEYEKWLHDDLKIMDQLMVDFKAKPDTKEETYKKIREKIHDIRSQGTTFGYGVVTAVSGSLCHLTVECRDKVPPFELIFLHVNSLHLVVDKKIEDVKGKEAQTLQKSLDTMVAKYLTKPSSIKAV